MRFKNVKHAEYKILQHLRQSGSLPLSVVLNRGVPGYEIHKGPNQPIKKEDQVALQRWRTACKNLNGVITNMLDKREKSVPSDDLELVPSPYLDSVGQPVRDMTRDDDLNG